ncbi:uncharacterized protein [Melopsittacus undulatus]|uniref:uncharacterized protein n=1 Tax=Melopsittacus undulatus TaxID=13146 RepID=UPI00146B4DC4|nr:uncharacterized protein LOC117437232 [Melopsittacus undulatus]
MWVPRDAPAQAIITHPKLGSEEATARNKRGKEGKMRPRSFNEEGQPWGDARPCLCIHPSCCGSSSLGSQDSYSAKGTFGLVFLTLQSLQQSRSWLVLCRGHRTGQERREKRLGMSSSGTNSKSKYQEMDQAGTSIVSAQILHPPALRTTGWCPWARLPAAKGVVPNFPSHPCPGQCWLQLRDRILGERRRRAGTDRKEEPGWNLNGSRSPSLPPLPLPSLPMCTHGSCCTSHLWPHSCGHVYLPGCRALGAGEGSCPSPAGGFGVCTGARGSQGVRALLHQWLLRCSPLTPMGATGGRGAMEPVGSAPSLLSKVLPLVPRRIQPQSGGDAAHPSLRMPSASRS